MDKNEYELQKKILFWGLVGPFLLVLGICLSSIKPSSLQQILSFCAIFGLMLSLAFDWKGALFSLFVLSAVLFSQGSEIGFNETLWYVGFLFSYCLSFFIASFSAREVISLINSMQVESKSRLESLFRLDEKLKEIQKGQDEEKRNLSYRLDEIKKELAQNKTQEEAHLLKLQTQEKETILLKELLEKQETQLRQEREKVVALTSEVKDLEALFESMEGGGAGASSLLNEYEKIQQENNKQKEDLKQLQALFDEEMSLHNNVISGLRSELDELSNELAKKEEVELREQRMLHELGEHAELLNSEKNLLENSLKKLEEALSEEKQEVNNLKHTINEFEEILAQKEDLNQRLVMDKEELATQFENKEAILRQLVQEGVARIQKLEKEAKEFKNKALEPIAQDDEIEQLQMKLKEKEDALQALCTSHELLNQEYKSLTDAHEEELTKLIQENKNVHEIEQLQMQLKEKDEALSQEVKKLTAAHEEELAKLIQENKNAHDEKIQQLQMQLKEKDEALSQEVKKLTAAYEDELAKLIQENKNLHEIQMQLKEKEDALDALCTSHELLNQEYKNLTDTHEEELAKLRQELNLLETSSSQEKEASPKKMQQLLKDKEKLTLAIQDLKKKRKTDQQLQKKTEGQLKQMKQQFEEKSQTLDETRRALFHMQEKVLASQRDRELVRDDRSDVEKLLEEQIEQLEKARKDMLQEHQEEVEALHDIIGTLTSKESVVV